MKQFFLPYHRITIDIDTNDLNVCLRKLSYGLRLLKCDYDVYVSGSKIGYHIVFYKKMIILKVLFYRFIIGDDKKRLKYDCERVFNNLMFIFDILFDKYRLKFQKTWKKHMKITDVVKKYLYSVTTNNYLSKTATKEEIQHETNEMVETNLERNINDTKNDVLTYRYFFVSEIYNITDNDFSTCWCCCGSSSNGIL